MRITDVVVGITYPVSKTEMGKEMIDEALSEMLRYDDGKVVSNSEEKGFVEVKLGRFTPRRWESFGFKIVSVVEAEGYTDRFGGYHAPQNLTGLYS